MKKIFQHPPEPTTGKKYWRSLDQLANTPEFRSQLEREFPKGADEFNAGGVSRRSFLKLMGASTALAGMGLSSCRRPEKHLVPFTKSAEWSIPGKPLFYATSMPHRNGAQPLIITTHDGRPTKVEGNPMHPCSMGATGTFAQATLLDMYDPDRSALFRKNGQTADVSDFDAWLVKLSGDLAASGGDGLAFLAEHNNSPTRQRLRMQLAAKYPKAVWAVYEPLGADAGALAIQNAFGNDLKATPQFDKADVILSLDCDFLGGSEENIPAVRAFSARRRVTKPGDTMNRLYVVENRYSVTGGMADHRLRLPVSQIEAFTLALAGKVGVASLAGTAAPAAGFDNLWLDEMAKDLLNAKGKSLVLAGSRLPAAVQVLVIAINDALGNLGKTITGTAAGEIPPASFTDLAQQIQGKKISTLFILGGNPVYNAPADLDWASLQKSVPSVVRLGLHEDETSAGALWHVPRAHFLESWGDGFAADGSYVSIQPMILPLFGGWTDIDIIARLLGFPKPQGPEFVRGTFGAMSKPADLDAEWNKFLHDGFLGGFSLTARQLTFNAAGAAGFYAENASSQTLGDGIEIVFSTDSKMDDGRYANNGWLQELPDSITKLTWDNAASMSMATAKEIGIDPGNQLGKQDYETIEITIDEKRKIIIPVLIAPGHADRSISIPLGYGRSLEGRIAKGAGVNVYPAPHHDSALLRGGVEDHGQAHGQKIPARHHSGPPQHGRPRAGPRGDARHLQGDPRFCQGHVDGCRDQTRRRRQRADNLDLHPPRPRRREPMGHGGRPEQLAPAAPRAWSPARRKTTFPIVGKEQVINGREMHWIRTDRYFASVDENDSDPEMVSQPMMCQHCENAPCETVCPVNATVHSDGRPQRDGLQPLHRHALLREQLPVQGAPVQLLRLQPARRLGGKNGKLFTGLYKWNLIAPKGIAGHDQDAEESERHRAHARRHGEMHLLRPAHPGSEDRREGRGRRFRRISASRPILSPAACAAGLPGGGDRLRRHQQSGEQGRQAQGAANAATACWNT